MVGLLADHTFAISSDGKVWPCWGSANTSKAKAIAAGSGDSALADCISQRKSRAGIAYGLSGVCHQTANRILDPASVLVSAARGYWASQLVFGTYGLNIAGALPAKYRAENWPQRRTKCTSGTPTGAPSGGTGGGSAGSTGSGIAGSPKATYIARLQNLFGQIETWHLPKEPIDESLIHLVREESRITVEYRLGSNVERSIVEMFAGARVFLLEKRASFCGPIQPRRFHLK